MPPRPPTCVLPTSLVLAGLAVVAPSAHAQEPRAVPAGVGWTGNGTRTLDPSAPRHATPDEERIGIELGVGALGPILGGALGAIAGSFVPCSSDRCDLERVDHVLVGSAIGLGAGTLALPALMTGIADVIGGHGNALGAYLGELAGLALASPVLVVALLDGDATRQGSLFAAAAITGGLFAIGGSLLGYEISHALGGRGERVPNLVVVPDVSFGGADVRAGALLAGAF